MKRLLPLTSILLACTACAQEIDIENQDATITSIGPLSSAASGSIVVPFTLRDREGDDQTVAVTICMAPGEDCGAAAEANGGDPMHRLPTVPKQSDVPHEFRWDTACGRWIDGELEPAVLDTEYVIGLRVVSGDPEPVYSDPFSLAELGVAEVGECP